MKILLSDRSVAMNSQPKENDSAIHNPGKSRKRLQKTPRFSVPINVPVDQTKCFAPESSLPLAVAEYRDFPEKPVQSIAAKHGISPSGLIYRARKFGVPGRRRGRHRLQEPSPTQRRIIDMYNKKVSGHRIARRNGVSPQAIYRLLNRWKHLLSARPRIVKAGLASSPAHRLHRDVKDKVVSFRLTSSQAKRVKMLLTAIGFHGRASNGRACRAVLLAALNLIGLRKYRARQSRVLRDLLNHNSRNGKADPTSSRNASGGSRGIAPQEFESRGGCPTMPRECIPSLENQTKVTLIRT
jgi:transposase-like protein